MVRTPDNQGLIAEIEGGIKKEVSVGCAVKRAVCSICGAERGQSCGHKPGEVYDGAQCFFQLEEAVDAYEFSFVAVPAQPRAGVLTYDELVDFWAAFDPYEMNTLLVSSDVLLKMLKLAEFQNPLTGLNFQGTGKLATPLGATLLRTSVLPKNTAIGLDKRYALELVQGSDVMVEYDKLIDRQLERAAITTISGFAKLFQGASRVLTVKAS